MDTFENVWNTLMVGLEPGLKIAKWTAHSEYLGDYMKVSEISRMAIWNDTAGANRMV